MMTLAYYEKIFEKKPAKLVEIKWLIRHDFKKMEEAFFAADKDRNIKLMRAELHKMSPIVSNLNHAKLLAVFEKYRAYEVYSDSLLGLNQELKHHLAEVYTFLQ